MSETGIHMTRPMSPLLVRNKIEHVLIDLYGSAEDAGNLARYDGFLTLEALHIGYNVLKLSAEDPHLVAFLDGAGEDLRLARIHHASHIIDLLVGNDIGLILAGSGEHAIDIRAETHVIEVRLLHSHEHEGGEQHQLAHYALAAAIDPDAVFGGYPRFEKVTSLAETALQVFLKALLVVHPHACRIPMGCGRRRRGLRCATAVSYGHGFAVVPCSRGRNLRTLCHFIHLLMRVSEHNVRIYVLHRHRQQRRRTKQYAKIHKLYKGEKFIQRNFSVLPSKIIACQHMLTSTSHPPHPIIRQLE